MRVHGAIWQALRPGASEILSLADSLSFARITLNIVGWMHGGGLYFTVFQNEAETSRDGFEQGEDV